MAIVPVRPLVPSEQITEAMKAWALGSYCFGRNDSLWNGTSLELNTMLCGALLLLENLTAANIASCDLHATNTVDRWMKPQWGRLKLNTDSAVHQSNSTLAFD